MTLINAKQAAKILGHSVGVPRELHNTGWFDDLRGPRGELLFDRDVVLRVKKHREYQRGIRRQRKG